jgi:methylthioribose-1-phosphate isomerase
MAQPIQRTTRWGEPIGDTTSILEIVREKLDEFVTAKPSRRNEFNGRRETAANLTELIEDMINAAMTKELSGAIKEARTLVAKKAQQILADELPKALAR